MEEKRGLFIVFEGIDGSGKSSVLWKFCEYLSKKNKHIHLLTTREPYKKREIREILRSDFDPYTQKEVLAELYVSDRREHVLDIIHPNLKNGVIVVSDRYKYATLAYQFSQGVAIEKLMNMHLNLAIPDIVFIIDVPIEVASERMKKDDRDEHKFEADKDFLNKVRHTYLLLPQILPNENIIIINGNQPIEKVNQDVAEKFEEFLRNKKIEFE